jgi:hypothetical protein
MEFVYVYCEIVFLIYYLWTQYYEQKCKVVAGLLQRIDPLCGRKHNMVTKKCNMAFYSQVTRRKHTPERVLELGINNVHGICPGWPSNCRWLPMTFTVNNNYSGLEMTYSRFEKFVWGICVGFRWDVTAHDSILIISSRPEKWGRIHCESGICPLVSLCAMW